MDANTTSNLFMSIPAFKTRLEIDIITVVKNPNSGKLFAETTKGNFKVEQALDLHKPLRFMYESEDLFTSGCIINVPETNVIGTL